MGDQPESRTEREHQELALLVAYSQDDFIRANGTDHGSAQFVADAIQAAGFTREPQLSEEELEILRTALQVAIGRSKQTVRGSSYRTNRRNRSTSESARTRRYRVLLEKLGGPKIPVAPVEFPKDEAEAEAGDRQPVESAWEREKRRRREISRLRQGKHDPYWRYRQKLRGLPSRPVGASESDEHSDDAQEAAEAVETAAEARWVVFHDRTGIDDGSEDFAHGELFGRLGMRDAEDTTLEYGVANFGDLEDVLTDHSSERSSLKWARAMVQPSYGDLLVARRWTPPKLSA